MKVELPERVGAAVAAKLRNSEDPDLQVMAKSLQKVLDRPSLKLEAPELEAAIVCIAAALRVNTSGKPIPRPRFLSASQEQHARNAMAKLEGIWRRGTQARYTHEPYDY